MNKTLKKAIHQTTESITKSFAKIEPSGHHKSTHFVSPKCMVKPPFEFIHALVTIYYRHCNFAKDFCRDTDFDLLNMNSRKMRIKFLFQIIVYVGLILGEPLDVLVSPAKILGGKDVIKTLYFLEKLAKSVSLEKDTRDKIISDLAQENKIDLLYRKAVKTRLALEKFIKIVREKLRNKNPVVEKCKQKKEISKIHPTALATKGKDYQRAACPQKQPTQNFNDCNDDNSTHTSKRSKPLHTKKQEQVQMSMKKNKLEKCVLQKKSGVVASKSNEKLCQNNTALNESSSIAQNPVEEEHRKTKKSKVKKFRVEKGVIIPSLLEIEEEIADSDSEEVMKLKTLQQIEEEYRRRMQRLKEKEAKLENRIQDTKSKEEHLQINEERVKRLAENLRKQHDKLKQDGLRQAIELDKLRLETTHRVKEAKELQPVDVSFEFDFDDEFMKKACNTPTITDLRLVLEKRERMLSKRHERMARAEKDLHRQMKELEDLKRLTLEEKENIRHSESKQIRQRQSMKILEKEKSDNKGRKDSAKCRNISSNQVDYNNQVQEESFSPSRESDTCCHQRSDSRVPYTVSVPSPPHVKKNKELTTITEEDESTVNIRANRKSIPRSLLLYKQQTHQHQENFVSLVHA